LFFGAPLFISLLPYNIRATPSTAITDPLTPLFTPSSPPIGKSLTPLLSLIPSPPPCYQPDHTDASSGGASLNRPHDGRHVARERDHNNGEGNEYAARRCPAPPSFASDWGASGHRRRCRCCRFVVVVWDHQVAAIWCNVTLMPPSLSSPGIFKSPLAGATGPPVRLPRWQWRRL
jgi:hypothetical protein